MSFKTSSLSICLLFILAFFSNIFSAKLFDYVFGFSFFVFLLNPLIGPERSISDLLKSLRPMLILIGIWLLSVTLGYITTSPMDSKRITEILELRWVIVFILSAYYATLTDFFKFKHLDNVFLAFTLLTTILVGIQMVSPGESYAMNGVERFRGSYHHPNNFALAVLLPWAFLFAWVMTPKDSHEKRSWKNHLSLLILSGILFGTYTRSAWMGMFACIVVALMLLRSKKILISSASLTAISLVAVSFNFLNLRDRFLYSLDFSKGSSSETRLMLWKVNWQMFLDHPFFGVGFFENTRLLPQYYLKMGLNNETFIAHAHNQFLQILVASGVVGFSAYISIFTVGIAFFLKSFGSSRSLNTRRVALGGLMVLVAFLFSGLTESPLMFHEPRNYLLLFAGACSGILLHKQAT